MDNIEKIKAEIKDRIALAEKCAEAACEKNLHSTLEANEMLIRQYKSLLALIDSQPEEKPSEDLNDEIKKFIEEYGYERGEDKLLIAIVARHFAEWQKEQMMKDAVNAEITVGRLPDDWSLAYNPDELHRALLKFKSGDKVKIIIVKEEKA